MGRLGLAMWLAFGLALCGQAPKSEKKAAPAAVTLSGCVDEAESGNYVLRGTDELKRIVTLHGAGFPDDNFAKHVGNQVKVTGKVATETNGDRTMQVTRIDPVADGCAPAK